MFLVELLSLRIERAEIQYYRHVDPKEDSWITNMISVRGFAEFVGESCLSQEHKGSIHRALPDISE